MILSYTGHPLHGVWLTHAQVYWSTTNTSLSQPPTSWMATISTWRTWQGSTHNYTDPDNSLTWPVCPPPIRLENWVPFLQSHPDKAFAAFIHRGLSEGFRVRFNRQGPRLRSHGRNHPSVLAQSGWYQNPTRWINGG